MKIEYYISQLLYRYQCVTVPGFGAFLTEIQSTQLQESSHSFYPPKKLISFNGYLKNNDGLLANHIAQSEKMAYDTAVSIIEHQVVDWKNKLKETGSIQIKNVGSLSLNDEKNVVFTPSEQTNYLSSSFGLTSFVSPEVKREIYKKEVEQLEEKTPIVFTPEKRNTSWLKYAAIFVVGAGILSFGGVYGNKLYQQKIEQETLVVQTNVQKKLNKKIQEATFLIENPLPAVTLSVGSQENTSFPYHVVAGAFKQEENAFRKYNELLKLGFKARKLSANKHGLFPVLYGSYSNYNEAQKAMLIIQKKDNHEAWLLIENL